MPLPGALRCRLLAIIIILLGCVLSAWSNEPPSISRIPDQATGACTPIQIAFSVSDPDSSPEELIVTATSSNANLVSNSSLILHQAGTNWLLSLKSQGFGVGIITVTATDGLAVSNTSFHLSVFDGDGFGSLFLWPISDQSMDENSTLRLSLVSSLINPCGPPIVVWLPPSSDNETLFPTSSMVITPDGTNATLVLRPSLNQFGKAKITVAVADNMLTASRSFYVDVKPVFTGTVAASEAGNLTFSFSGAHPGNLVVEGSQDLKVWLPLKTNLTSTRIELNTSVPNISGSQFFRLNAQLFQ